MNQQPERDKMRADMLLRLGVVRPVLAPSLDALAISEWSPAFERFMRNRPIVGAMRYQRLGTARRNWVRNAIKRLELYEKTGNPELLVDGANFCLAEFVSKGYTEGDMRPGWHDTDRALGLKVAPG